jgi:hypothetical protein
MKALGLRFRSNRKLTSRLVRGQEASRMEDGASCHLEMVRGCSSNHGTRLGLSQQMKSIIVPQSNVTLCPIFVCLVERQIKLHAAIGKTRRVVKLLV